jgi:hypothetical protein
MVQYFIRCCRVLEEIVRAVDEANWYCGVLASARVELPHELPF